MFLTQYLLRRRWRDDSVNRLDAVRGDRLPSPAQIVARPLSAQLAVNQDAVDLLQEGLADSSGKRRRLAVDCIYGIVLPATASKIADDRCASSDCRDPPRLNRPKFLAIVSSTPLATMLAKKSSGRVDGFVVEGPSAGGHNAPPRGKLELNELGEPVYGPRDETDVTAISALGIPFWLAGSYGTPQGVRRALDLGAAGVQVGTAFAFCKESGMRSETRDQVLRDCRTGRSEVRTDPLASPTGFPLKVLQLDGSLSDETVYAGRRRVCDLGYLRQAYRKGDGTIGWRCPGEPVGAYTQKGGAAPDTCGRKCLCNGLLATVGLEQTRRGGVVEPQLVTCGSDVTKLGRLLGDPDGEGYSAVDVIDYLLSGVRAPSASCASLNALVPCRSTHLCGHTCTSPVAAVHMRRCAVRVG